MLDEVDEVRMQQKPANRRKQLPLKPFPAPPPPEIVTPPTPLLSAVTPPPVPPAPVPPVTAPNPPNWTGVHLFCCIILWFILDCPQLAGFLTTWL